MLNVLHLSKQECKNEPMEVCDDVPVPKCKAVPSMKVSAESAVLGNCSDILTRSHTSKWNDSSRRNDRSCSKGGCMNFIV